MPIFNQIEVFLDGTYSKEERVNFIFRSRKVCNFVERKLSDIRFDTDLSRVNLHISRDKNVRVTKRLKAAPFLEVRFFYPLPLVSVIENRNFDEHLCEIIKSGLFIAQEFMEIPIEICNEALKLSAEQEYANRWIQSDKSWGTYRSLIEAELTTEKFILTQTIYRDNIEVASKQIGESKPREMLFIGLLGKAKLSRDRTIIYEKNGKMISQYSLEKNLFF